VIHQQDLSLYVEPLAKLVGPHGLETTPGDLVHRAIVDSDSAATDILVERLGGTEQIQRFLNRAGIQGVRIDRDERQLQTEIVGLTWRPEYVDPRVLNRAIASVSAARRDESYHQYQNDIRDTATPLGMALLLQRLATGHLLSPASTRFILQTMTQTATFPNRLKAGVPAGWLCMHKTGTSGSWRGVTAATNDVAILKAPDGSFLSIAVFVADTKVESEIRANLMRDLASATVADFR
jgi:beta-lactamase class A